MKEVRLPERSLKVLRVGRLWVGSVWVCGACAVFAGALAGCARTTAPRCAALLATAPRRAAPEPVPALLEQRFTSDGISYQLRASRLANLAWQLDCLAGFGRCSRPAYELLWSAKLSTKPSARAALARWAELRGSARGPVGESAAESRSLLPLPHQQADLWQRVRLASVLATDAEQYEASLYALTNAPTAHALRAVIDELNPEFDDIWRQALPGLQRAMTEQAAVQSRADVALTIQRVQAFYGVDLGPRPTLHFDLLLRPEHASPTYATQLLDRALTEVVPSEPPALRIQVPVHEMFHYFFASTPQAKLDDLANRFATSANPDALAAYGLLDEVLAASLAQGVLGRALTPEALQAKLSKPLALYDDPFIDAVAKALLPRLDALLAQPAPGGTVFGNQFFDVYLSAVAEAYPHGLPPVAQIRPLACAYAKELAPAYELLHAAAGRLVGSTDEPDTEDARGLLEDHATWGRVLLLRSDQLPVLSRYAKSLDATATQSIRAAALRDSRFAYAARAPGAGPVFVLVADSAAEAQRLVTELLALPAPFSGLSLQSAKSVPKPVTH